MKQNLRAVVGAVLLLLTLGVAGCGGTMAEEAEVPEEDASTRAALPAETVPYTNDGMTLSVPAAYDSLVEVETPSEDPEGTLFIVTERASRAWGEQAHPGEDWGDGWLFSLGRVDESVLHEMLCFDMSGAVPFAADGGGDYYIFCHPTDVRFVRETYDPDSEDWKQWTELNEWAWSVRESFVADNQGLKPCAFTNTSPDICLAQLAYQDEPFFLSAEDYGPLDPEGVEKEPYVTRLLDGLTFALAETDEIPDEAYISLEFPLSGERLDFFLTEEGYVRESFDGTDTLYRAEYRDGETLAAQVMGDWYAALARAAGLE